MSSLSTLISGGGGGASYEPQQSFHLYKDTWYSSSSLTISPPSGKRARLLVLVMTNARSSSVYAYVDVSCGSRSLITDLRLQDVSDTYFNTLFKIGDTNGDSPFVNIEGDTDEDIVIDVGSTGTAGGPQVFASWEIL